MTKQASLPTVEPDLDAAMKLLLELLPIEGLSGRESAVAGYVVDRLRAAGVDEKNIAHDDAHKESPFGGEVGNLIVKLPGTNTKLPRRLLMAHLDTVPTCIGSQPVRDGAYLKSGNPQSGLGADDRSGVAVVLSTCLRIVQEKLPHPPLTFFFPVQEEVGLFGARHATLSKLGKPVQAFNWDGGAPEKLTVGATGAYRMKIDVEGLASHAGVSPDLGVSAATIFALALAKLHQEGWHGLISMGGNTGTSNIGAVHGGEATNVVLPKLELKAEARSHDPRFRLQIVKAYQQAFEQAAAQVVSKAGKTGGVQFTQRLDYESFKLDPDEPCVISAESAVRSIGLEPIRAVSNGGLDANWMTERGIPTVSLGCGQESPHTLAERLHIPSFEAACRIALRLATTVG